MIISEARADRGVNADLSAISAEVAGGLSGARLLGGRAYISTTTTFPSGAIAVVAMHEEGSGRFVLSDLGQGQDEADLMALGSLYERHAKRLAERVGLSFERGAFGLAGLTREQLPGGVIAVANAGVRALEHVAAPSHQRTDDAAITRLARKLQILFPNAALTLRGEVTGASTHSWRFDAVLRTAKGATVFDVVSPHATAVAFANMKFGDVSRRDDAPTRVAVVRRKAAFGDLLNVVSQSAHIVEEDAADRAFLRAAA